jgi:hypothetical protein
VYDGRYWGRRRLARDVSLTASVALPGVRRNGAVVVARVDVIFTTCESQAKLTVSWPVPARPTLQIIKTSSVSAAAAKLVIAVPDFGWSVHDAHK